MSRVLAIFLVLVVLLGCQHEQTRTNYGKPLKVEYVGNNTAFESAATIITTETSTLVVRDRKSVRMDCELILVENIGSVFGPWLEQDGIFIGVIQ